MEWCICPDCGGPAIEVSYLKGTDCSECGHITAADAIKLARRKQRKAEEAKRES